MPTVKPFYPSETLLKLEFLIDNKNTGLDSLLKDATIHFELNKIPFAKFTFISSKRDKDKKEELPIDVLIKKPEDPLIEIEVKISFEGKSETFFKGIIKSLDTQEDNEQCIVKIECKDKGYNLTLPTKEVENNNQTFEDKLTLFTKNLIFAILIRISRFLVTMECSQFIINAIHNYFCISFKNFISFGFFIHSVCLSLNLVWFFLFQPNQI